MPKITVANGSTVDVSFRPPSSPNTLTAPAGTISAFDVNDTDTVAVLAQLAGVTVTPFSYYTADPDNLNQGIIAAARAKISVQPTANDTISIGGKAFKFVAALGAAEAAVQVKLGLALANTLASLVRAINGTSAPTEWTESTTAFASKVLADAVDATHLRIRNALARGGAVLVGTAPTTVLASSLTQAGDGWLVANLNATGAPPQQNCAAGSVTVLAAMITATQLYIECPFTPTGFDITCRSSAGVGRAYSDATTIVGNAILITLGGGASPNIQANDVLNFEIYG